MEYSRTQHGFLNPRIDSLVNPRFLPLFACSLPSSNSLSLLQPSALSPKSFHMGCAKNQQTWFQVNSFISAMGAMEISLSFRPLILLRPALVPLMAQKTVT